MKTSNVGLLAEIDGLAQISCCETDELQVVQHIKELERNQAQKVFFIVRKRNGQELFFSKKESAELFLSKNTSKAQMALVASCFCDID